MAGVAVTVTVTTTKATTKTADPKTRSLELAQEKGYTSGDAARTLGWVCGDHGELVSLAVRVASARDPDTVYVVGYLAARDDAECECPAAQHGRGCWHRGVAIQAGRQSTRIFSPSGRAAAELAYRLDLAHEGNAAALGYEPKPGGVAPIVREAW